MSEYEVDNPPERGAKSQGGADRINSSEYRSGIGSVSRLVSPARDVPTHHGILHGAGGAGETEHQLIGGVFGRWTGPKLDQQGADALAMVGGGGQSAAVGADPEASPGEGTEDRDHR